MSLVIRWQDREYDIDPTELNRFEAKVVQERSGLSMPELIGGVVKLDLDAIAVLCWLADRRAEPELKFSDYNGPSAREVLTAWGGDIEAYASEALGKFMPSATKTEPSPSLPTDSDTTETSTTG